MRFDAPLYLLLLPLLLVGYLWLRRRYLRRHPALAFPDLQHLLPFARSWRSHLAWYKDLFLLGALLCVTVALARPQIILAECPRWDRGVDIMIALDMSSSMLQQDLQPNRFEVTRAALMQWSKERRQREDRLGLVLFARQAFTACPLTSDHSMLREMLSKTEIGVLDDDTAIGDAIATSLARLRHSKLSQRAIILLTDGENNSGQIHPLVAAGVAKQMKIPVFAMLVGKRISPILPDDKQETPWRVTQEIAKESGGKAWRVKETAQILQALQAILDRLAPERRKPPKMRQIRQERFADLAWPALLLLLCFLWLDLHLLRDPLT